MKDVKQLAKGLGIDTSKVDEFAAQTLMEKEKNPEAESQNMDNADSSITTEAKA